MAESCLNCGKAVKENYCANCGQAVQLKRIDANYVAHEIGQVLNFERGILFTVWELLIRPGENIRDFLSENRRRLVKPIIFIIATSLIFSFINQYFNIEEGYVNYDETKQSTIGIIFKWVENNYGYANIIMGIFIALWTKLFFRKYGYNFFEILILLCFVMGIGMLIYSVFALFQGLTHINIMQIGGVIGFIYSAWAIGQFFDKTKFSNFVKAFLSYLLGFFTFSLIAIFIGVLTDLVA